MKRNRTAILWQEYSLSGKLRLAKQVMGQDFLIMDMTGEVRGQTAGFPAEQISLLRNRRQALLRREAHIFTELTGWRLERDDLLLGWLVAACPEQALDAEAQAFAEELVQHVLFLLWHEREVRESQRQHRDQFLYDVLYNNFASSEEIIRLGRLWNMNFDKPHHVVVVEFDRPLAAGKNEQLLAELDDEWTRVLSARFVQPI